MIPILLRKLSLTLMIIIMIMVIIILIISDNNITNYSDKFYHKIVITNTSTILIMKIRVTVLVMIIISALTLSDEMVIFLYKYSKEVTRLIKKSSFH